MTKRRPRYFFQVSQRVK